MVRKAVGYLRYDTEEELEVLNELYDLLRLYTNFVQPLMKLKSKVRVGSQVRKKYDQARTPFLRVQESLYVSQEVKEKLSHLAQAKIRASMGEEYEHLEYISI